MGAFSPNVGGDLGAEDAYALMWDAINATNRPMLFSISPLTAGCNTTLTKFYSNVVSCHFCLIDCNHK